LRRFLPWKRDGDNVLFTPAVLKPDSAAGSILFLAMAHCEQSWLDKLVGGMYGRAMFGQVVSPLRQFQLVISLATSWFYVFLC